LDLQRRVLALLEPRPANDLMRLDAQMLLASSLERGGERGAAHQRFADVLAQLEEHVRAGTLAPTSRILQSARIGLGMMCFELGEIDRAIALQRQALAVVAQHYPPDDVDQLVVRQNLGSALAAKSFAEGRVPIRQAFELLQRRLVALGLTASPQARSTLRQRREGLLSTLLSCRPGSAGEASIDPAWDRQDLEAVLALRSITAQQARIGQLARHQRDNAALQQGIQHARRARQVYVQAAANGGDAERQALRLAMEQAESALWRELTRLPQTADLLATEPLVAQADNLPEHGAAIVTVTYRRYLPPKPGEPQPEPTAQVAGFVVDRGATVRRVELGSAEQLESAIEIWRRELIGQVATPRGKPPRRAAAASAPPAAERLTAGLAQLFAALPRPTHTLLICPDGALASIPWEALPIGDGERLCDRFRITYGNDLSALTPSTREATSGILAIGGVDFAGTPWPALPGSAAEVEAAAAQFRAAHSDTEPVVLTHATATREGFTGSAEGKRYLHLATHGFSAGNERWELGERLGMDRGSLCGLVFAADTSMTATEIAGLDLGACELAVLAACDTGTGPRVRFAGDAQAGLLLAFHLAGARNVIASLWPVDDAGARAFFAAFYRRLWSAERPGVAAAFHGAQQELRPNYGPGVWAAFVRHGRP
jgi:CHAT domain-containing protein